MTSPFKTFLSCINKHTLSQAGEFLFPNSTKDLIRLQKLFSPVLWPDECLVIFYKAVTSIAIKVLKHMGALPSFMICLLLRISIYGLKTTQYKPQFTTHLGILKTFF